MERKCLCCAKEIVSSNARKKFCSDTCRKRYQRSHVKSELANADIEIPKGVGKDFAQALFGGFGNTVEIDNSDPDSLYSYTLKTLTEADVLNTPNAQIALKLASRIDHAVADTGSAYAALCRELSTRLDAALQVAKVELNPIDELRVKREQRLIAQADQTSISLGP